MFPAQREICRCSFQHVINPTKHSKTSFPLCPQQEKTQCSCTEVPHRIYPPTLSPALDLPTWTSPLDPLFAVAPLTLVIYSMLAHPNGWIISDPCNSFWTQIRRLCRVSIPWTSWQIETKCWKTLQISTVIFSLCRSPDYTQHLVCVPVSVQLKSPGSTPGTAMDPWCFQWPSPAHRAQQGLSEDTLCPFHTPAWSHSYTLSWAPALQKAPGTHVEHPNFLHLWLSLLFVFKLWNMIPEPGDQAEHGVGCLYTCTGTAYTTFKTAVIRKWAMKCVSGGTLIIWFIA